MFKGIAEGMIRANGKRWIHWGFLLVVVGYSLTLTIHFMLVILNQPYVGVYTLKDGNKVTVSQVAPYSWGESARIQPGDTMLSIDGQPAFENRNVRIFNMVGLAHKLTLDRDGTVRSLVVDNNSSQWALLFYLVLPLGFFVTCFVEVLFLYLRKERKSVVHVLIALLVTLSPLLFEIAANARHDSWSLRLTSFSILFTLVFLVHFLRDYFLPCGFRLISDWMLGCLYLCASMIFINSCFFVSREVNAYYQQELVFSVFVFSLLCVQLARLYTQIKASEYGRVIHLLIVGFMLSTLPFIALYAAPNMIIGTSLVPVEWTTPFIIILPITLCSMILSSAFIDMSFYIGQFGYYCALSFIITLMMMLTFLGVTQRHFTERPEAVVRFGLVCFVTALLILYVKEYSDYRLRDMLHPHRVSRQSALNRFLQTSKSEYTLRHVALMLRRAVQSELPVEDAGIVIIKADGQIRPVNAPIHPDLLRFARAADAELEVRRVARKGFRAVLRARGAEQVIFVGKWVKPGRALNLDERIWLETLINYARVVVDNLYKTEGLMRAFKHLEDDRAKIPHSMNRWLFSISENERAHLSRDIHDTNIQDQLAIAREMDAAMKTIDDPETRTRIDTIRDRILDNADMMRKLIREMYPADIFHGELSKALDALFRRVNLSADFYLETAISRTPHNLSKQNALCLFRAVQELLGNAMKHAHCTRVWLGLAFDDARGVLSYRDNGIGFDPKTLDPYFSTMGLTGIISRVQGLGGTVEFGAQELGSASGGFALCIKLPITNQSKRKELQI